MDGSENLTDVKWNIYAMKVISSDTDNPKGSITYKNQELVKE